MSRHIGVSVMVLLLIAGVWGSALAQTEEELRAVHRASVEALNAHDVDQYVSYLTDDVVYDYVPMPAPMNGKEEVAAFLKAVMQAFPDWDHYQRRILVSGNQNTSLIVIPIRKCLHDCFKKGRYFLLAIHRGRHRNIVIHHVICQIRYVLIDIVRVQGFHAGPVHCPQLFLRLSQRAPPYSCDEEQHHHGYPYMSRHYVPPFY